MNKTVIIEKPIVKQNVITCDMNFRGYVLVHLKVDIS